MTCQGCGAPLGPDARFCGVCGHKAQNPPSAPAATPALAATAEAPAVTPPPVTDMIGRVIAGRYRLLAKLGEGGMGAVFRTEQLSLKRTIALKLLRPDLSANSELVRRFNAEAEMAAKLSHPHTVTLYDFGQDSDGTLFIAMELIAGQSLRDVLTKSGSLALAPTVAIALQICDSLSDAHSHGIVHRDLKPDNVMLSSRGSRHNIVKVLDFGIAKLRDQAGDVTGVPITQAGALLGTPQYMAPEQIRSETVDDRADVYALGIILYEMLTGALPFEAPTLMAMLSCHLLDAPIPLSQRRLEAAVPAPAEQLIMAMLSKSPADRPASMDIVAQKLSALVPSAPGAGQLAGRGAGAPGAVHSAGPLHGSLANSPAPVGPAFTPAPPGALREVLTPPPSSTPVPDTGPAPALFTAPTPTHTAPNIATAAPPVAPTAAARMPPTRAQKRTRGRWLALLIALLIGGATAAFLVHRSRTSGSEQPASTDTGSDTVPTDFVVPPTREIFDNSEDM